MRSTKLALAGCILLAAAVVFANAAPVPQNTDSPKPGPKFVANTYDGSNVNVELCDESVEIKTKYGTFKVPSNEIALVTFKIRSSHKTEEQISEWVGKLGHNEFKTREHATSNLKTTGERAYQAALRATKSTDPEVARRAEEIARWIKARHQPNVRTQDTLQTANGDVINGIITAQYLNVFTPAFGKQEINICELRTLDSRQRNAVSLAKAPATLAAAGYGLKFGTTATFRITLPELPNGTVAVWGSGPYSLDSNLGLAAIHAGCGEPGDTVEIVVSIRESPQNFSGSNANGVKSQDYTMYPYGAFEFVK